MQTNIRIEWRPVKIEKENFRITGDSLEAPMMNVNALEPIVIGAESIQDELIALLQVAAEIEHALMIQYLFTLSTTSDSKYKVPLKRVAIQEMGHFLSVQNVLLCLGGIKSLHLYRDLIRPTSKEKPIPYSLEPLSKFVLGKYTVAEIPAALVNDPQYKTLIDEVTATIKMSPNPVGLLYSKILKMLDGSDINYNNDASLVAERDFWKPTALYTNQVTLETIPKIEDAKALIKLITEQGEGPDNNPDITTHFEVFYDLYTNFKTTDAAKYIVTNPMIVSNPEFEIGAMITNDYSKLWTNLFNKFYCILLLDTFGSVITKKVDLSLAKEFGGLAFGNMSLSQDLTAIIIELPVHKTHTLDLKSNERCGPTYELPTGEFLNFQQLAEFASNFTAILEEIRQVIKDIEAHAFFSESYIPASLCKAHT